VYPDPAFSGKPRLPAQALPGGEHSAMQQSEQESGLRPKIGLALGPLLFLILVFSPTPAGLDPPAMRMAEGPISTPRLPAPRSMGTPRMWIFIH